MFSEKDTYQMIARGHAPASEPFREWVFGEVLPSIRKTGSYNVNASELATSPPRRPAISSLGRWRNSTPSSRASMRPSWLASDTWRKLWHSSGETPRPPLRRSYVKSESFAGAGPCRFQIGVRMVPAMKVPWLSIYI